MKPLAPSPLLARLILVGMILSAPLSPMMFAQVAPPPNSPAPDLRAAPNDPPNPPAGQAAAAKEQERKERAEARMKARMESMITAHFEERRASNGPMFKKLGLTTNEIEKVSNRLDQLHRGAIKAGDAMLELLQDRSAFKREMRELLGEEGFERYKAYELAKPFRREIQELKLFAAERKASLDPNSEGRLLALLQEFHLDTTESWEGPFDPAPRPSVGTEPAVARADERTARISAGLPGFMAAAAKDLSANTLKLVGDYYAGQLNEFAASKKSALMTPEEREAAMTKMMEELEEMRRKAGAPPQRQRQTPVGLQ